MEFVGTKKGIKAFLTAIIGFMTFITLAFTLCYSENEGKYYNYFWKENGFTLLDFNSTLLYGDYAWSAVIIGIICYGLLIVGLTTLILSIFQVFNAKNFDKALNILSYVCVSFGFLYMLAGLLTTAISGSMVDYSYTLSYIPFIIIALIFAVYLCLYIKDKSKYDSNAVGKESFAKISYSSNIDEQRNLTMQAGEKLGAIYAVKGAVGKNLVVYENKCVISTKATVRSVIAGNFSDGEKTIYFSDLTGIQFKKGSAVLLGYLQFETASTQSNRRGNNWGANYESENSFTFEAIMNELMEEISRFVQEKLEEIKDGKSKNSTTVIQQTSVTDEILNLKKLLDMGVITQEEFEAKKKELLGL